MPTWKRDLYILVTAQVVTSMGFSIIFPFLPLYIGTLKTTSGLSTEVLSGIVFSSQAFAMMLASPIWGIFADRYGKKLMVVRAMMGGAVTISLMGFVQSAEELIVLRTLQGLLSGVISASSALAASFTPKEKSGYAMGLLQLAMWAGVAAGPLLGGTLADLFGFRITFIITGILLFSSSVVVYFGIHTESQRTEPGKTRPRLVVSWKRALSEPVLPVAFLLRFMSSMGSSILLPVLPLFVQSLVVQSTNISTLTGLVIGISSISSTAGAIILAKVGDRIGHSRIVIFSALSAAIIFSLQGIIATIWLLIVLTFLAGLSVGRLIPSLSALLARNAQKGTEGRIYGLDNALVAAGRAIAPLAGAFIAIHISYRGTFLATGLLFFCSAGIAAFAFLRPAKSSF